MHDWLYELRLYSLEQMSGMGADLFLCDPHRIIVTGPRQLRGKQLDSRDIRSGMALIAAALAAQGAEPGRSTRSGRARLRAARGAPAGDGRAGRAGRVGESVRCGCRQALVKRFRLVSRLVGLANHARL